MRDSGEKFRLTIPIEDAFGFSIGEFNMGYDEPTDGMRQLVGAMVLDALQYAEHWRVAAEARAVLAERWPNCPAFHAGNTSDES